LSRHKGVDDGDIPNLGTRDYQRVATSHVRRRRRNYERLFVWRREKDRCVEEKGEGIKPTTDNEKKINSNRLLRQELWTRSGEEEIKYRRAAR